MVDGGKAALSKAAATCGYGERFEGGGQWFGDGRAYGRAGGRGDRAGCLKTAFRTWRELDAPSAVGDGGFAR